MIFITPYICTKKTDLFSRACKGLVEMRYGCLIALLEMHQFLKYLFDTIVWFF